MNKPSKGDGSQSDSGEYTLPLNPARVRSVLTLFDEDDRYTDEASALNTSVITVLTPIVKEELQKGFSIREIVHALHLAVTDLELDIILDLPLR